MTEVHNDIIDSVVHIIDTCAERGAFKGKELQGVGNIRTALQELKRRDLENQQEQQIDPVAQAIEIARVEADKVRMSEKKKTSTRSRKTTEEDEGDSF